MSGKSARTSTKTAAPRPLADIQKEYQEGCLRAGQLQYQVSVLNQELETLNQDLVRVNKEAAVRIELDKATSPEAANV